MDIVLALFTDLRFVNINKTRNAAARNAEQVFMTAFHHFQSWQESFQQGNRRFVTSLFNIRLWGLAFCLQCAHALLNGGA